MDARQRAALQTYLPILINELELHVQNQLFASGVLTETDMDLIKGEITQTAQRLILLKILQRRDHGWNALLDALTNCKQAYLSENLKATLLSLQDNNQLDLEDAYPVEEPCLTLQPVFISKLWEVPQRNPFFTGRDPLLERLKDCLAPSPMLKEEASPNPPPPHKGPRNRILQ